jgi:hypothetical protein
MLFLGLFTEEYHEAVPACTVACLLLSSSLALAETVMLRAPQNVASEVPPKTGNGTGFVEASYNTDSKVLK